MASLIEAAAPNSDQLNACDFIVDSRTYTIREISVNEKEEQKVSVFFEGVKLPWKPCKSMMRVMMLIWRSSESKDFIGKKLTLYNDPKVLWAGKEVGGIRISHASGIDSERKMSLRATKKTTIEYVIKPLSAIPKSSEITVDESSKNIADDFIARAGKLRDLALHIEANPGIAGESKENLAQQWFALCDNFCADNPGFDVPENVSAKMCSLLGLKSVLLKFN